MTAEHSTYTYETGEQETVTLKRGPATPHGHALLKIEYSDGQIVDCYVSTAWLRDRADQLADTPRPLTPDAITDEMVKRAAHCLAMQRMPATYSLEPDSTADVYYDDARDTLTAALTEPPARPEWDALHDVLSRTHRPPTTDELTDVLYAEGVRVMGGN